MASKRIRCICGKIYDPAENACCPACGVEVRIESISVVAPPPQPATTPASSGGAPAAVPGTATPPPLPTRPYAGPGLRWALIGGGIFLGLALMAGGAFAIYKILAPGPHINVVSTDGKEDDKKPADVPPAPDKQRPAAPEDKTVSPSTDPKPAPADKGQDEPTIVSNGTGEGKAAPADKPMPEKGSPAPTPTPPAVASGKQWILEGKGDAEANGKELMETIEKAAEGDTIVLREAAYACAPTFEQSVRIVADKGAKPVLQGSGTKFIVVDAGAKGVVFENLIIKQLGKGMTLRLMQDAGLHMENCTVSTEGAVNVMSNGAASLTIARSRFHGGTALVVRGPGKMQIDDCEFSGSVDCVRLDNKIIAEFHGCRFSNIGMTDANGVLVSARAVGTSVILDKCDFRDNHATLTVDAGASLTISGGAFTGNCVVGDPEESLEGLLTVSDGAKTVVSGVAFNSNRQGLFALHDGHLEVIDCHFSGNGFKVDDDDEAQFFSHQFGALGKGASLTIRGSDISHPISRVASVENGGEITMEDCQASGGAMDIVTLGGGDPCRVNLKKCKFSRFTQGAIVACEKSTLTMEDCEVRENHHGVEVRDAGTQFLASNVSFIGNDQVGLIVLQKAQATATRCTWQDNGFVGVVAGMPGDATAGGAVVNLVECKLYNSRSKDVRACEQSRVTMTNCTFAPAAVPQVLQDPSGVIEADPPVQTIASNTQGSPNGAPKAVPAPVPAQKNSASNSTGGGSTPVHKQPQQPQRSAPSSPPTKLPDKVGEVIDAIDKIRRLVR